MVDLESLRIVVRVDVALPVAELLAVPASVAQRLRRLHRSVLAHVRGRFLDGDVARVRLRREREVDRRLREIEPRLRQPDVLDRLCGGDGDDERLRIGIADVLGGEHDHPPRDEARVLAALEHRGEVEDRCVGVGSAHRLDERGREVVVRIRCLVVDDGTLARRVLDVLLRDRAARGLGCELDDVECVARVAARAPDDEIDDVVGRFPTDFGKAAPHDDRHLLRRQRLELVHLHA